MAEVKERRDDTPRQATFRTKIGGMSCSFCTNTIRRAYQRVPGVHEVGVSLAHEEGRSSTTPRWSRRTS